MSNNNDYKNKWREKRVKNGLCASCGKPSEGKRQCNECLAKVNQRYLKKADDGFCVRCGKQPPEPNKRMCTTCLRYIANHFKKTRQKRLNDGVCTECGQAATNGNLCEVHFQKRQIITNNKKQLRKERRKNNLCEECGEAAVCESTRQTVLCADCYLKGISRKHLGGKRWKELKELFAKQSLCPYTGQEMTMGVNASLDHIVPRARGGSDNKNNLQFVFCSGDFDVNFMKGSMTDIEFRNAIKMIYNHIFGKGKDNARKKDSEKLQID